MVAWRTSCRHSTVALWRWCGGAGRGPGWGGTDAVDVPAAHLLAAGYSCVAQESRFVIAISTGNPGAQSTQRPSS